MALTADHIIMLGRGRIIADAPVAEIIGQAGGATVRVRSPHATRLATLLAQAEVTVVNLEQDVLQITGITAAEIGDQAAAAGIVLHELTSLTASLEDAYMSLTQNEVEYRTGGTGESDADDTGDDEIDDESGVTAADAAANDDPDPRETELQEAAR